MSDTVVIHTTHDSNGKPGDVMGEVYVNGRHILTIRRGNVDVRVEPQNAAFDQDTIRKMDTMVKTWIKSNLKK